MHSGPLAVISYLILCFNIIFLIQVCVRKRDDKKVSAVLGIEELLEQFMKEVGLFHNCYTSPPLILRLLTCIYTCRTNSRREVNLLELLQQFREILR